MNKKDKNKSQNPWIWPIKILLLAVFLSLTFSIISELTLTHASIILAIFVILVFVGISVLFDAIGLAVASCSIEPFTSMAARKVKGSKQALSLIKNADKVCSICDVIGDVCGILSGAGGASIVAKFTLANSGNFIAILIPSLIAALIAGITIFGKSAFKKYAINHCDAITLNLAKFINCFSKKD